MVVAMQFNRADRDSKKQTWGFTLVELLVVIAIIGVLVALLLPAVQAAREAARRTQCRNQLKQIGLGCLLHENSHGYLPSGGWSREWCSDPNRGYGKTQSGSWQFNIMPFIEEGALHDSALGRQGQDLNDALAVLVQRPVALFYCPSRRAPISYPHQWTTGVYNLTGLDKIPAVAKNDYAANTGDSALSAGDEFAKPMSPEQANDPLFAWTDTEDPQTVHYQTGVMYYRSELAPRRITDGLSKTYLAGEKYLNPDAYDFGVLDFGENQSIYAGFEWDNHRVTRMAAVVTQRDRPGLSDVYIFGSAHPAGFQAVMCDGAVRTIGYDVDLEVHRRLGHRFDELPIDMESMN